MMKNLISILLALSLILSVTAYAEGGMTLMDFIGDTTGISYDECTQRYYSWSLSPDEREEIDKLLGETAVTDGEYTAGLRLKYLLRINRENNTSDVRIYADGTVTMSPFDSDVVDKCCRIVDFDSFYNSIEKYFTSQSTGYGITIPGKQQTLKISDWAVEEYNYAKAKELLAPYMGSGFMTENITREQFCDLVVNILEDTDVSEKYQDPFSDSDNPNVLRLAQMGVINGKTETKFAPNDLLTREEAAVILFRLTQTAFGYVEYVSKLVSSFDDYDEISEYAAGDVMGMCVMGVMNGVGDNRFDPKGLYTIEQAIATIVRLYKLAVNEDLIYEYDTPLGKLKSDMDYNSFVNFAIECDAKVQLVKDRSDYVNTQYTVIPVVKAFTNQDTSQYISFDSFAEIYGGEWKLNGAEKGIFEFTYDIDVNPEVEPFDENAPYGESSGGWPNKGAVDGVLIFADMPQIIVNGKLVDIKWQNAGKLRNGNIIMVNNELYIPVQMVALLSGYDIATLSIIWD